MKLIATDLDGTLLNQNHEISEENKKALQLAKESGVEVVVATGRSYSAAKFPLMNAGLDFPIICLNGAKIYDKDDQLIRSAPLDKQTCRKIQQVCQQNNMYFEVFTNKATYSESREKFLEVMIDIMESAYPGSSREDLKVQAANRFQQERIETIHDFDALFDREDIEVYKILAFSLLDNTLDQVKSTLENEQYLTITSSGLSNLEFNHPDAQKGIAVKTFAKKYDIKMENVMAIGDNFNDVSMIEAAGFGVAMGNANEKIKTLADYTTKANHEDGVAFAVREFLNK
ncbi:HAD family phosphatase [Gracilibacillus oryzae]|uniref:HAD family phosphatase n=1 Tax=Gracilibacillus oryzae TaxID=1672701 RepID=A0A7C8GW07_9BACI|nr:Cof-type HAD-IIB family hydrolase [Gracilibacillus oryzae]KAB8139359.1 HAD family phosphatase [Gracilibacillus oryzae]